jgi:hypothetical protein
MGRTAQDGLLQVRFMIDASEILSRMAEEGELDFLDATTLPDTANLPRKRGKARSKTPEGRQPAPSAENRS